MVAFEKEVVGLAPYPSNAVHLGGLKLIKIQGVHKILP